MRGSGPRVIALSRKAIWAAISASLLAATVGFGSAGLAAAAPQVSSLPGAPTLTVVTPGNGQVVASWTPPTDDGGSMITGYVVTPYLNGVAQQPQTFMSAATTETVTGLTNGNSYIFDVAAMNNNGTGPRSAISAPVAVGSPLPPAPVTVTATAQSLSAVVSWTVPADNGSPITSYTVSTFVQRTIVPVNVTTAGPGVTSTTILGLTAGQTYYFKVAATNANGTGPTARTPKPNLTIGLGAPQAPSAPSATAGNGAAVVSWSTPYDGGSQITGYVVTPYLNGVAQPPQTFMSAATTQTVTGLTNSNNYTFTVAAMNTDGTGAPSAPSLPVRIGTPLVPGAPAPVLPGDGTAVVSWNPPADNGSQITGYVVTPYLNGLAQLPQTFTSPTTSETVTGLTNGKSYTFDVAAINDNGTGLRSAISNPVTVGSPLPPAPVTATAQSVSAIVSWTVPADNGSPITSYTVSTYRQRTIVPVNVTTAGPGVTSTTIPGLTVGQSYFFTVAATNANGTGLTARTPKPNLTIGLGAPQAPSAPSATAGNGAAVVSWSTPYDGGSQITGYVVTPYVGGMAQQPQTFMSPATTETVTGLTNGVDSTFTVAAINANGTGAPSAPSLPVRIGTPLVPGAPAPVLPGDGTAVVSWNPPADNGSQITGYVVTPYLNGVAQPPQTFTSPATSETVTGLTNGKSYTFDVAAINDNGTGLRSAISYPVTVGSPLPPAPVTATAQSLSAIVSWTAPFDNGSAITGYIVAAYRPGNFLPLKITSVGPGVTSTTFSGLAAGQAYFFTVAATNANGTGRFARTPKPNITIGP